MTWLLWTDWANTLAAIGVEPLPGDPPFAGRRGALTAPGTRLGGTLDGKRIELVLGQGGRIWVPIEPAMDLGLSIEPQGVLPRGTPTGIRALDALYAVLADEPSRAMGLLDLKLTEALVALLHRSESVAVGDGGVSVRGDDGAAWLRFAAPVAVEIAHRIEDRRRTIPVPASLTGHRAALGRLAAERLLFIDDCPIRLAGAVGEVRVQCVLSRVSPGHFIMDAVLTLESSLNLDLQLEPASALTPLKSFLLGQTDHRLGDAELDAAFHVRTSAPEVLAKSLDAEGRGTLLACASAARSLHVDDRSVTLALALREDAPSEPADLLRGCIGLLGRLFAAVRAAPPSPRSGPFR